MTTIKASHKLHQAISHHDIQLVIIFAITSHYDHHKDHHEISIFILFSPSQWWWAWLVWWLPLLPLIYNSSNPGSVPKWKKRPMSQPKALIDEELPGTTGLVALKISLCVWWHWTWLIHTADCPALSLIFTFSDSKTCLKPSNAKCVNWFWSVYPKSILSPIASDLKFLLLMPRVTDIGKVERKFLHRQMCYRKKAQMVSHAHPSDQKTS